ncbi:isoleucine--tRNA ligase [Ureaplasma urealyticum]|uniref:Isoleucine--tRNA ligase n=3 Tax=Ureaplasma urealyticum TaxID=2130 RepID=A0AAP9ACF4_UREUR|nr:isoleucine--tRNA ligase [Ureaplasma urealyticum]ACI60184.1 isoleucyl-tRNA synthetase [Ureaplasma urealyticum serovar 10 str. ATCC 33699]EDT49414.1 isoleucyl-tRNA synthetase [Ureaplasma urealyticum serovar 13 str. ATCC 33698]EDU06237.1 isoleucyl-tRNA synthetase [Ureaplasma urealyticum serovar 5 str. ATCC 27817]EDU57222.1 isoleucyl-tRNA synthetase [Ureaplasma urealyticum serovar 7 str. ATCC 27819]EDU67245.1 isoleucyl-tRNA synthetase [Ureaplasma urealyticum serovar 11 str. ATCC 33695]
MKDYKSTLNMPSTAFEMRANLNIKEPKIQQFWIEHGIYEKLLAKNKDKKPFVLHDGPPYANGNIHIGHALNKILKDFVVSYHNMNNYYSPYIPGWDTHGLPIEVALSKKVKLSNLSVNERREQCKKYALEQVDNQIQQFLRLGMVSDFKQRYLTLDHSYEIDQLKLFANMLKKGFIYQDFKPVFWSWSSQTALAESEIEYGDRQSPAIYVKMQVVDSSELFNDKPTSFVIWTTTPWTLPANLAIAIHPELTYSLIEYKNENYVIAKSLVESFTKKVGFEDYKLIKDFKASALEKIKYISPITKKHAFIIMDEYVSANDGTGLVHNAPAFGLEDYYACKKYGIETEVIIDQFGKYNALVNDSELENMFYEDANQVILDRLICNQLLIHHELITHSVAHDWRTKKPVMYRATKQWFVSIEKILPNILQTLKNDVKSTSFRGIERMHEMIVNRKEWCISRQRVWGVPIPMIFDENHEAIMDPDLVENIINVLNEKGVNAWFDLDVNAFLTPKYLSMKNKTFYKEKDIMDVWFDSGSSYNVLQHYNLPYPADVYLEGYDQYRGWFNSSLITGTILNNKAPYKYLVAHGMVLDGEGYKMSKSKGNVVDPLDVCKVYGADVLRLWIANSDYQNDTRISEEILKQNAEIYRRIRNTLFKYSLSILNDFEPSVDFSFDVRQEDQFVLNEFNELHLKVIKAYESFDYQTIVKLFNKFILDLSSWYFENIKDDMYCLAVDDPIRKQIQSTVYWILKNSLIDLTPIIPHTTEEAYSFLNDANKKESIRLEDFYDQSQFQFKKGIAHVKAFFSIKDEIFNELENARKNNVLKKNNEALVTIAKNLILDDYLLNNPKLLAKWFGVAKIEFTNTTSVVNANFKKCLRCWNHFADDEMYDDELSMNCYKVINKIK